MENFKFILFSIIILALFGLLGYWAVVSIQDGSEYVKAEKIKKLEKENEELKKKVENLTDELAVFKPETPEEVAEEPVAVPKEEEPTPTAVNKNQTLINELQKLIDDGVVMKLKSRGTRVGTIQNFLNIYNKTSNRVDNDFGASTRAALIDFQKDQGLSGDGEAGKTTFEKMIEWLQKPTT